MENFSRSIAFNASSIVIWHVMKTWGGNPLCLSRIIIGPCKLLQLVVAACFWHAMARLKRRLLLVRLVNKSQGNYRDWTYQSKPDVAFHDLVFLVLQITKVHRSEQSCFMPICCCWGSVDRESKLTTLMSWMKANPKATSTFWVMFCTGLMSLL